MLEKQTWIYLLINCIVTIAIMLILFKYQEYKIKTLIKKHDRYYKKNNNKYNDINKNNIKNNKENEENEYNKYNEYNEDYKENNNIENDIDSFIDPIENNDTR